MRTEQIYFKEFKEQYHESAYKIEIYDRTNRAIGYSNPTLIMKEILKLKSVSENITDEDIMYLEELIPKEEEEIQLSNLMKYIHSLESLFDGSELDDEVKSQLEALLNFSDFDANLD